MNVLILTSAKRDAEPFHRKLRQWGILSTEAKLPSKPRFIRKRGRDELDPGWLQETADFVLTRYPEADVVHLFLSTKDWKFGGSLKGIAYHRAYNGFLFGAYKDRNGWDKTARHELMHHLDNLVFRYLGLRLEDAAGVRDWDDDVVHRRHPRSGKYTYDYDRDYDLVRDLVAKAIERRGHLSLGTAIRSTVLALRPADLIT